MTTSSTQIHFHNTDPVIYDALARLFKPLDSEQHEWVTFTADGITLTFFKTQDMAVETTDEQEL